MGEVKRRAVLTSLKPTLSGSLKSSPHIPLDGHPAPLHNTALSQHLIFQPDFNKKE